MRFRKAPALRDGDTVAVVSPAGPSLTEHPARGERAVRVLESLGLRVRVMPHARGRRGHASGSPEERAADLNAAFRDPEVRLVLAAIGGWNSNAVLPLLDYEALRRDPKIVQGHSDITAVLNAVHKEAGLVTVHGPQLVVNYAGPLGMNEDTLAWWRRLLFDPAPPGDFPHPPRYQTEYPWWGTPEELAPPTMAPNPPRVVRRPAVAQGRLVGGNLQTLEAIAGTRWWPDFEGALFFWEEVEQGLAAVERSLTHLRHLGVFDRIVGMVVGKPHDCKASKDETFEGVVMDAVAEHGFPVAFGLDFGHFEPNLAVPIGARARFAEDGALTILEGAVA